MVIMSQPMPMAMRRELENIQLIRQQMVSRSTLTIYIFLKYQFSGDHTNSISPSPSSSPSHHKWFPFSSLRGFKKSKLKSAQDAAKIESATGGTFYTDVDKVESTDEVEMELDEHAFDQ
jgi:hypothetical protein